MLNFALSHMGLSRQEFLWNVSASEIALCWIAEKSLHKKHNWTPINYSMIFHREIQRFRNG